MKKCFLWSIVMLTVFFTSCKQFDLEPDDNGSGTGSQKNDEVTYYIKHSWGSGADGDWSWQEMEKESNGTYSYAGLWGGTGANINTKPNSTGALWFSRLDISGASSSLSVGDKVRFYYSPEKSTLSVIKISSGNGGNYAKVRFRKADDNDLIRALGIAKESEIIAYHEFGNKTGTSGYYDIPAGYASPKAYWLEDGGDPEGWYGWESLQSYDFQSGGKYTYIVSPDEVTISLDGTMNAPQKVVAKRKLIK